MALTAPPQLHWSPRRRPSGRALGLLALVLVLAAALVAWAQSLHARIDDGEARLAHAQTLAAQLSARSLAPTSPARSPTASRQLGEQLRLLNRDWVALSRQLAPADGGVRLLGIDVNAGSGALRVTGRADDAARANDYARALAKVPALAQVRLLALERRGGKLHFEVGAQWTQ